MGKHLRLGKSGSQRDLQSLINDKRLGASNVTSRFAHFSLGFRQGEKVDAELCELAVSLGVSLSIHPVDINLSMELVVSELRELKDNLSGFPFSYLEEDLGLWRYDKLFLGAHQTNQALSRESLTRVLRNLPVVQEILGVPVVVENPPVYSNPGSEDFWWYYSELCSASGCKMAFDIGHYIGFCKVRGMAATCPAPEHAIWDSITTIHLSGMKTWSWGGVPVWLDQHSDIFDATILEVLKQCVLSSGRLQNVLLEMEGATEEVQDENIRLVGGVLSKAGLGYDG
ncbi:hypothetical protein D3C81_630400 [compost metagenome]